MSWFNWFYCTKGKFEVKEIYRAFALVAVHLHLINDVGVASRFDRHSILDEPFYKQNIRVWVIYVRFLLAVLIF